MGEDFVWSESGLVPGAIRDGEWRVMTGSAMGLGPGQQAILGLYLDYTRGAAKGNGIWGVARPKRGGYTGH